MNMLGYWLVSIVTSTLYYGNMYNVGTCTNKQVKTIFIQFTSNNIITLSKYINIPSDIYIYIGNSTNM